MPSFHSYQKVLMAPDAAVNDKILSGGITLTIWRSLRVRSGSEGLSRAAFQRASRYDLSNTLPHFLSPLAPKSLPLRKPETKQHLAAEASWRECDQPPLAFACVLTKSTASVLSSRREWGRRPGAMVGGALQSGRLWPSKGEQSGRRGGLEEWGGSPAGGCF